MDGDSLNTLGWQLSWACSSWLPCWPLAHGRQREALDGYLQSCQPAHACTTGLGPRPHAPPSRALATPPAAAAHPRSRQTAEK